MTTRFAVRAGEGRTLALACLAFFSVLAAYYVIRPVRDQLAGAVGSIALPLFYAATFVATLLITPLFGWLVAHLPRRRLLAWSYGFFIVCLIGFAPLFAWQDRIGARTLGVAFFVWVSVFNLFVVSLFWSLMADICSSEQARRLFPLIAIGGNAGALAGPGLTGVLAVRIGVAPLLVVSAALLTAALAAALALSAHAPKERGAAPAADAEAVGGSLLAGLRAVFVEPFLRRMALLMLLSDGVGTLAYALVADYASVHFADKAARTAFFAGLDLRINLLGVLLQLTLTRWLLVRIGFAAGFVLPALVNVGLLLAVASLGSGSVAVAGFALPIVPMMLVLSRGFAYGVTKPASDALYTRAVREARYKGKNFVETAVWRFGDLAVTSALNGLRAIGAGLSAISLLAAAGAGLAGWIGWRATRSRDLLPEPGSRG